MINSLYSITDDFGVIPLVITLCVLALHFNRNLYIFGVVITNVFSIVSHLINPIMSSFTLKSSMVILNFTALICFFSADIGGRIIKTSISNENSSLKNLKNIMNNIQDSSKNLKSKASDMVQ